MGFHASCIALPSDANDDELARLCRSYTQELYDWIAKQQESGGVRLTRYDGTIGSACRVYQEHPLSPFHKVKHNTKGFYVKYLTLVETTIGKRVISKCSIFDAQHWYDNWRKPAIVGEDADGMPVYGNERIDRAHDAISMVRTVVRFVGAALKRQECKDFAAELKTVQFERGGAREQEMTYAHASAFIKTALELGRTGKIPMRRARAMAIGTGAQFELLLRQKDVIGEWAKTGASRRVYSGMHQVKGQGEEWIGFFAWENLRGWRWRTRTSKSKYRAAADYDLSSHDLLHPLLELVPHDERTGAIVTGDDGLPVREHSYRKWFREIANVAGIPADVWNMDSRAGGATEADDAGASIDAIRDALTHTDNRTTVRYLRRRGSKIAEVADARRRKRAADEGNGTT